MKYLAFLLMLSLCITVRPRKADAEYKCRAGLAPSYCKFATECVASGHHVWERQFADWLCYDEHGNGKFTRKQCKETAERSHAAGVIDFHHFTDGTCYLVYGKKG